MLGLDLAMGAVLNPIIEPPGMKLRSIEIGGLFPGHAVVFRSGRDDRKCSQEDEGCDQSVFQRGSPFPELMTKVQIK